MLDDVDRRILRQMQADPDLANAELAERCNLTPATCWRRVEKLRADGILLGVEARIDWRALGYAVHVSLRITLDKTEPQAFGRFIAAARAVPEVLAIQTFLGRVDVRLSLIARDMAHYQEIYRHHVLQLPHIADIEALMQVSDVRTDAGLPL